LDLYFVILEFLMMIHACCLLALPIGKGMEGKGLGIGVRFGHKILGSNFTQCMIDIWNIMYAHDGWPCSIEMQASRCEVLLGPIKGNFMFNLNFELVLVGNH
jgi:hypothetical protein